jgi:hypothetical protein
MSIALRDYAIQVHLMYARAGKKEERTMSDGEKPGRERPREFVHEAGDVRGEIMARWEEGWRVLFGALAGLTEEDFGRTVYIREEPHSVVQAILRNLLHTAHHVGQIDLLATALGGEQAG